MEEATQSQRRAIRDAALDELVARGIDGFTVEGVAKRAGVDPRVIIQMWHDRRVLLMEAQLSVAREHAPTPDTGSLRADLLALTESLAELAKTPQGRAWFHRLLPAGGDADLSEVRSDFWQAQLNEVAPILQRAAERGELRDGIDHAEAMRMFSAAIYYDVIFADTLVRPEYAARVLDIFIHGITR